MQMPSCSMARIILVLFVLANKFSFAQQPRMIEILNADVLEFDESIGLEAKRLIGNVLFSHENTLMKCDSAYYYNDNKLDAFSNVKITKGDSVQLNGNLLKYDGNTKSAFVSGNVVMNDKKMTMITPSLEYNLNSGIANYQNGAKITNEKNVLTSKKGYYYSKNKTLFFRTNVVLVNPDYTIECDTLKHHTITEVSSFFGPTTITGKENKIKCENGFYDSKNEIARFSKNAFFENKNQVLTGDTLFYNSGEGYGKAIGKVSLTDTTEKMTVTGDVSEFFDQKEYSYITGNVLLMQFDKKDTLFLTADTLKNTYDTTYFRIIGSKSENTKNQSKNIKKNNSKTSNKTLEKQNDSSVVKFNKDSLAEKHRLLLAYRNVKFFRKDMQGVCDSMAYTYLDSLMNLYKKPVLWNEENQMSADKISIKLAEGKVYGLFMNSNSFIGSSIDSIRFNQIKGKKMRGFFHENELYKIHVTGNGESIFYVKDDADSSFIGINVSKSAEMFINMKEKKIDNISLLKSADAEMFPVNEKLPEELILKDFIWYGNLRPAGKNDLMKRN